MAGLAAELPTGKATDPAAGATRPGRALGTPAATPTADAPAAGYAPSRPSPASTAAELDELATGTGHGADARGSDARQADLASLAARVTEPPAANMAAPAAHRPGASLPSAAMSTAVAADGIELDSGEVLEREAASIRARQAFENIAFSRDARLWLGAAGDEMRVSLTTDGIGRMQVHSRLLDNALETELKTETLRGEHFLLDHLGQLQTSLERAAPGLGHRLTVATGLEGWDASHSGGFDGHGGASGGGRGSDASGGGSDHSPDLSAAHGRHATRRLPGGAGPQTDPRRLVDLHV